MTSRGSDFVWQSAAQRRRIGGGLRRVEERLQEVAAAYGGTLGGCAAATLAAGGKRMRPGLVLLCARRATRLGKSMIHAAAAVELLHMATLVHDDVLDGAALRRGRPTVYRSHGGAVATSVGNYLLAAAFAELVATGDADVVQRLSAVAAGLSEGELLQQSQSRQVDLSPSEYLRRCTLKTADLFAVSCALGAALSGLDPDVIAGLASFGQRLGLAFQIFDDILDFSGDVQRTGKQPGTDVRGGTMTLPLIFAVEERPELGPLLSAPAHDDAAVEQVIRAVRESRALERARLEAAAYIVRAREELTRCGEDVEAGLLVQVAEKVVDRYS